MHHAVVGVGAGIGGSELQSPTQLFTRDSHYLLLNHLSIWLNAAVLPLAFFALGFPGGSDSKDAMLEAWVQSLGLDDTLQKEMATDSSILAWRIPRTEEASGLQSIGSVLRYGLSDSTDNS